MKRVRSSKIPKLPKAPPATRKAFGKETAPNGKLTKGELDKAYVQSKKAYVDIRAKTAEVRLAHERGQLIEKRLVTDQAAYLFVTLRQEMLSWPVSWARRLAHAKDEAEAKALLTDMVHSGLRRLRDLPKKVTDPRWMESLDEEEEG